MENKTDSSFERSLLFRVVAIIVCIIIACISFFGLAKSYSSPESKINKETIKYLDEKKTTALELSASATALSNGLFRYQCSRWQYILEAKRISFGK